MLDLVLQLENLRAQLRTFLRCEARCCHGSLYPASPAEHRLRGNEAILHVFLFTEGREGHDDFEGFTVSSHADDFHCALGHFLQDLVDPLLDLLHGEELLDQLADFVGELGVGEGLGPESLVLLGVRLLLDLFGLVEDVDESLLNFLLVVGSEHLQLIIIASHVQW